MMPGIKPGLATHKANTVLRCTITPAPNTIFPFLQSVEQLSQGTHKEEIQMAFSLCIKPPLSTLQPENLHKTRNSRKL